MQDTLSVVGPENLKLVLSPRGARIISECQEIVDHIKGSPAALAQVRGELPGRNMLFGLPDKLYGFDVVIENTVRVSSKKGGTVSRSFLWPQASAVLCARPGELEGIADAPNFSTAVVFVYSTDDMTVETMKDTNNRVTKARVVDHFDCRVVAPASGVLFTNIL